MANLPFALSGAAAPTSQPTTGTGTPTFDPSSIKTEADLIAWLMSGPGFNDGKGGLTGSLASGPSGMSSNPYGIMGNFYNVPVYHSAPRQSVNQWSGTVQPGQPWPTGKPMPQSPMMPSNNSGGGSAPPPPVTVPPVQGTGGGFTGVPGMNGTPGGYGVNLLTPPPVGTGAQWRNTMKYGA